MEKKTKHRILGVIVILGIAVIVFPFIRGKSDFPSEAALVKAPPFPDQPVTVASEPELVAKEDAPEDKTVVRDKPDDVIDTDYTAQANTHANELAAQAEQVETQNTNAMATDTIADKSTEQENATAAESTTKDAVTTSTSKKETVNEPAETKPKAKSVSSTDKPMTAKKFAMQVEKSAWAIQVGSFQNKSNALKLVNRLRSNGYHAFMHEASNNYVKVYVGPENKKAIANLVADRIEYEMNLHGLVVNYQPLKL